MHGKLSLLNSKISREVQHWLGTVVQWAAEKRSFSSVIQWCIISLISWRLAQAWNLLRSLRHSACKICSVRNQLFQRINNKIHHITSASSAFKPFKSTCRASRRPLECDGRRVWALALVRRIAGSPKCKLSAATVSPASLTRMVNQKSACSYKQSLMNALCSN